MSSLGYSFIGRGADEIRKHWASLELRSKAPELIAATRTCMVQMDGRLARLNFEWNPHRQVNSFEPTYPTLEEMTPGERSYYQWRRAVLRARWTRSDRRLTLGAVRYWRKRLKRLHRLGRIK